MACRAVRARARAVRFNETQLRDRERTAVWGFLCEHRANPTALNAVRSAPVRRAHVCGVVTGACFPRPALVSGAGSARYDGGFASCAARPILRPVRKLEARPRIYAVSAPSSTARSSSQFAHRRTTSGCVRANVTRRPMVRPHPDELARIGATRRIGASGVGVYVTFSVFGTDTPPPLPVHDAPRCRLNRLCSERPPILHGRTGHSLLSLNTHHPPN